MKIAVLGAGAFGTALGGILANNGYDIDYYDSKLEKERLVDVLFHVKCIVLCVPSKAVGYLLPHLPKNIPMIVATKGILGGRAFEDFQDWMVLSGPGFAKDIKNKKQTILTVTDERVRELFAADYMEFDMTKDRNGVLFCGALKNVYALLAGYRGLLPGAKEYEDFIKAATEEMKEILEANGAEAKTVDLACGVGDLRLTCDTPSRNYKFGSLFRADAEYRPEETVEGITALGKIKRGEMEVPETATILREIMEIYQWV